MKATLRLPFQGICWHDFSLLITDLDELRTLQSRADCASRPRTNPTTPALNVRAYFAGHLHPSFVAETAAAKHAPETSSAGSACRQDSGHLPSRCHPLSDGQPGERGAFAATGNVRWNATSCRGATSELAGAGTPQAGTRTLWMDFEHFGFPVTLSLRVSLNQSCCTNLQDRGGTDFPFRTAGHDRFRWPI